MRKFIMAKANAKKLAARGPYLKEVNDPDQVGQAGIRVRQHRLARAWTVAKLAEVADLSQGTISGIESAKSGYSADALEKLAAALETTVGGLFDVDPRPGKSGAALILYRKATKEQRSKLDEMAKIIVA